MILPKRNESNHFEAAISTIANFQQLPFEKLLVVNIETGLIP
jgi:hypothetical protein